MTTLGCKGGTGVRPIRCARGAHPLSLSSSAPAARGPRLNQFKGVC